MSNYLHKNYNPPDIIISQNNIFDVSGYKTLSRLNLSYNTTKCGKSSWGTLYCYSGKAAAEAHEYFFTMGQWQLRTQ